jgi:hypothetical protein
VSGLEVNFVVRTRSTKYAATQVLLLQCFADVQPGPRRWSAEIVAADRI